MGSKSTPVTPISQNDRTFPPGAVEFLFEGLAYTAEKTHGPAPEGWRDVATWLQANHFELTDVPGLLHSRKLPSGIAKIISDLGGPKAFDRHVSGEQLCLGIRDLAIERWGMMAPAVLRSWNIRRTRDIGDLVFSLIAAGRLQKQPTDSIEEFDAVFDFRGAFDNYRINLDAEPAHAVEEI